MRVLSESYPMYTNMTGFIRLKKNLCVHVLWMNKALNSIGRVNLFKLSLHYKKENKNLHTSGLDAKGEPMAPGQ